MGSTASSSSTASRWEGWHSATLLTRPHESTGPHLRQLATWQRPSWKLQLGLTLVGTAQRLAWRLREIGFRMKILKHQGRGNPSMARWNKQNRAAGAWLSVFPNWLNGTSLPADKWRDTVHLWYNHSLLDTPLACNGCGAKMTVEHALACKTGGLVHIWHDDVADEWRHLCGTALSPGWVKFEPRTFFCVSQRVQVAAGNTTTPLHQPLLQTLSINLQTLSIKPQPLRNGAMPADTGSGNVAVWPYLIWELGTRMPDPARRTNLQKFLNSTRRRRRTSIYRIVWKCGRTLHQWFTLWTTLWVVRLGMRRRG